MPAITFKEIKQNWDDQIEDDRFTINYNAKIDNSVRIEPYSVIEEDVTIGKNTIIGPFVQLRAGTFIGENCRIGGHCTFEGQNVILGNNIRVGTHCCLCFNTIVEDNAFLGNGLQLSNDKRIDWPPTKTFEPLQTRICNGAKIGVGCTILPGLIIGANSVVGAGSVVTKSVLQGTTVYGNPAKPISNNSETKKALEELEKNTKELRITFNELIDELKKD